MRVPEKKFPLGGHENLRGGCKQSGRQVHRDVRADSIDIMCFVHVNAMNPTREQTVPSVPVTYEFGLNKGDGN